MAVSVAIEVIEYALVATGGWLAHAHGAQGAIVALDTAGSVFFHMIIAPIGVSVLACAAAMVASGLFRRWLSIGGLVVGGLIVAAGIVGASAAGSTGGFHDLGALLEGPPVVLWWLWMLATGVVLFRARPSLESE